VSAVAVFGGDERDDTLRTLLNDGSGAFTAGPSCAGDL
jgi:hypothetical protein